MKIEDYSNLTPEKIERLSIEQGNQVSIILHTPGWKVIENVIKLCKDKAEDEMERDMRLQSTREKAIFHAGVIAGTKMVRKEVWGIVERAIEIANQKNAIPED